MKKNRLVPMLAAISTLMVALVLPTHIVLAQDEPPQDPTVMWSIAPSEQQPEYTYPSAPVLIPPSVPYAVPPPPSGGGIQSAYLRDMAGQGKNRFTGSEVFYLVVNVSAPGRFWLYEYYPKGEVPQGHWLYRNRWIGNAGVFEVGPFVPEPLQPDGQYVLRLGFRSGGTWTEYPVRYEYYKSTAPTTDQVPPPVITSFSASLPTVKKGKPTTLTWNVQNAQTVQLNPPGIMLGPNSASVSPTETTTYTLTAFNSKGVSAISQPVIVTVQTSLWDKLFKDPALAILIILLVVAAVVIGYMLMRKQPAPVYAPMAGGGTSTAAPTYAPPTRPGTAAGTQAATAVALARLILADNSQIALTGGVKTLGRNDFQRVAPADRSSHISRSHLAIGYEGGQFYIEDRNSTNGTRLNGSEIKATGRHWLKDGDQVDVGGATSFTFRAS